MKVCLCTPSFPPDIRGGGEISVKLLYDNLKKKCDVTLIKNKGFYAFYKYLKNNYKDFDVIHSYNNKYSFIVGYLCNKYHFKSVCNLNGFTFSGYDLKSYFIRNYIDCNDKIIVLSDDIKNLWVDRGISKENIIVIPNMVDPCFKVLPKKNNDKKTFYFIGNYAKWRNYIDALELCEKYGISIKVVGEGWGRGGQVKNVDMPKVYSKCDFYLYFARYMAFSRSMIEAIQNNCIPIVDGDTANYGVLKDFIYNKKDFEMVVSNYDKIFADTFKAKGILYKYFNPDFITDRYISIYEGLL